MTVWISVIRVLFVFFFLYTMLYLLQWLAGLCLSMQKLSHFAENRRRAHQLLPIEQARRQPVTVLIPAHNEQDCICDTVRSLVRDDYSALQIVVVDDGSTDETALRLCREFGLQPAALPAEGPIPTARVRACYRGRMGERELVLLCKENGGKSDALNCGLNSCRTPLCVVLDADTVVQPDAIRILASRFQEQPETIVCAGAVGSDFRHWEQYPRLTFRQKCLLRFQQLEYFRTFYVQRLLFEQLNANVIVSGAFAMFDTAILKAVGGYQVHTIGEDMELSMRLHAFCRSQGRRYRIAYVPEAQCSTQFPFRYRDYWRQRRRWHIGMAQSFRRHCYMLGSRHYGWAGILSGTFFMGYEFLAPFIELLGLATLAGALAANLLDGSIALFAFFLYTVLSLLSQMVLLGAIGTYGAAELTAGDDLFLLLASLLEIVFYHPLNMVIKLAACFQKKHRRTWEDLHRTNAPSAS